MVKLMIAFITAFLCPIAIKAATMVLQSIAVPIPGGEKGLRLDDMHYSQGLHKVIVPATKTGKIYLVDPATYAMASIGSFTSQGEDKKGHHLGVSSADEGDGFIFAADNGNRTLYAVDEETGKAVAKAPLADAPDIVRYVPGNHEVWVTEPDGNKKQIEIFRFIKPGRAIDTRNKFLSIELLPVLPTQVSDGPESLTIDNIRQQAYTNLGRQSAAIDLKSHAVIDQWPSGCFKEASGTAIDERRGFLFVACKEGKVNVFDVTENHKLVSSFLVGAGVDLIDFNPILSHLYVPGSKSATLSVLGVSAQGQISLLGVSPSVNRGHCVTGDGQNNIWVCDPQHGQLLRYKDAFPKVS